MQNNAVSEASKRLQQEVQKLMMGLKGKQEELKEKESEYAEMNRKINEYRISIPKIKIEIRGMEEKLREYHNQEERDRGTRLNALKQSGVNFR